MRTTAMRTIASLATTAALLSGCAQSEGGSPSTQRRDWAQGNEPKKDAQGQQPAPVQADPSAHNTQAGEVVLFVNWVSENRTNPVCEWSKNQVSSPCANMGRPEKEEVGYMGSWEHEEIGVAGDTFTVTAQGTGAIKSITCEIAWKGKYYPGISSGNRCGASLVLS